MSTDSGKIREEIRNQNSHFKPFIVVYFLAEMFAKMKWNDKTKLHLTIGKDGLKINANDLGSEKTLTNELRYVMDEEELQ